MTKRPTKNNEMTKKQIAVSRRRKKQQTRVLIGVGIVALLVLGIAIAGLLDFLVIKPARPVAMVHDTRVRTDQYQKRVLYERFLLDGYLSNIQRQLATLDSENPDHQFLIQYYNQMRNQVLSQRMGLDQQVAELLIEEELVRRKAVELGLSVSEEELNEEIRARIAGQSGFITESRATAIASTAVAATSTAITFTPTPMPTATSTLTATAVATETAEEAQEFPTPAPMATRHVITDEEFNQSYSNYLNVLKEQANLSENEYREIVRAELLRQKVAEHFAEQVPAEALQANVSHIQVDSEEGAQAVVERLDAGEDFALVASEVSTDTFTAEDGGELGWFPEGELVRRFGAAFEEAAFSLNPGEYSDPIASVNGWHIVKVNDRAVRELSPPQLQSRQQQAYIDWLAEAKSAEGVQNMWEPDMAPPDPFLEQQSPALPAGGIPPGSNQGG